MNKSEKTEYLPINEEALRSALKDHKRRTGKSLTWLSYRIAESGSMLSNALIRGKIPAKYVPALTEAGIDPDVYLIKGEKEAAPEAPESAQAATLAPDLSRDIQRLRDDIADLRIEINALRQDRQRDTEKLLQSLARISEGQLSQKALGEEIVSGIILALGQANIDEPIRSAYDTIRNDLQRDIYRAIKGGTK